MAARTAVVVHNLAAGGGVSKLRRTVAPRQHRTSSYVPLVAALVAKDL